MLRTNNVKEEKNVRNSKTNVGADASVRPYTKANPNHVGVGLDQPGSVLTDPYKIHAITLVALVITIIILIILAGVTLNLALGENGIFQKSKQAVDKYKDEAQKEQNTLENIYQDMIADEPFVKPEFNPETDINLDPETAQNADKYGWKVEGYDVELGEVGCWRLFYQDDACTYLISDKLIYKDGVTGFKLKDYYQDYWDGSDVNTVGRKLSPMLTGKVGENKTNFFTGYKTTGNIRAMAWLTDPEQWNQYKGGDAEFAIGGPTIELFAASFDAVAESFNKNNPAEPRKKMKDELEVDTYGYSNLYLPKLDKNYNHGIYNKGEQNSWWLASVGNSSYYILYVNGTSGYISNNSFESDSAIRPVVCIQTKLFNEFENSGKYKLINDPVE